MAGLVSPTNDILLLESLAGLKRILAELPSSKEPFRLKHIQDIIKGKDSNSVADTRNVAMMILAFYALLQVDELKHIKVRDLEFFNDPMELTIPRS